MTARSGQRCAAGIAIRKKRPGGTGSARCCKACLTQQPSGMRCTWSVSGPNNAVVCAGRTTLRVTVAVASHVGALLFLILRPLGIGLVVFLEDLFQPFIRLSSGLRHIKALPQQHPEEGCPPAPRRKIPVFQAWHQAVSAACVERIFLRAAGGRAGGTGLGGSGAAV